MAGQITIVSGEDYEKNLDRIKEIVTRLPVETREWAMRAFRYESKKEFNNAANMCRRVLEFCPAEDAAELRMLLGRCNFALKKYFPAEIMFQNLIEEMPDEKLPKLYMGLILHEMEEYENALTYLEGIWPVSFVHPDYVDAFGDSLMRTQRKTWKQEIFAKAAAAAEACGYQAAPKMLNELYQNLLDLDLKAGKNYVEDEQAYFRFLEAVDMNEKMQDYLSATVAYFSGMLGNRWYRPIFIRFADQIRERGYLKGSKYEITLESAFASAEAHDYNEDIQVNDFMKAVLSAVYLRAYDMRETGIPGKINRIMDNYLTYAWYVCQYYGEHQREFEYIRRNYPIIYGLMADLIERVKANAEEEADRLVKELCEVKPEKISPEQLKINLLLSYARATAPVKKELSYLHKGDKPYKRMQAKVGRNDPCPCGSGRKFKQCCGR